MISKITALKNHAGFIRYFKNTSWMMGEQFLRIIAGLFVGIWVARYLGPEQFGLFSYVLSRYLELQLASSVEFVIIQTPTLSMFSDIGGLFYA